MCKGCDDCIPGEKLFATNVAYERKLPDFSGIKDEKCITTDKTTTDLYELVGKVVMPIEESDLCDEIIYPTNASGDIEVRDAIITNSKEICKLINTVSKKSEEIIISSLTDCIDWKSMKVLDKCDNEVEPKTLCDVLQRIIDKLETL